MRPTREQSDLGNAAYFVTSQTAQRQPLFRHERWARLLQDTIVHYAKSGYSLYAYVIMPDHVHMLISPSETIEKAVRLFKGGFSFKAKRAFGWKFEIWQQGFTDHRIRNETDWQEHLAYIRMNPVRAGLVPDSHRYSYMSFPQPAFPQELKPENVGVG